MNPEDIHAVVRLRLEQAECALRDAQCLSEGGGSARAVLNRAYYAMFYAVLALLQGQERIPVKHQGVISLFDRDFVHKGLFTKQNSKDLHLAFQFRQDADYKSLGDLPIAKAREMLQRSRDFVATLSNYLAASEKNES